MSSLPKEPEQPSRLLNKRLNEPWRYRCPECGSTTVEVRKRGRNVSPFQYKEGQETEGWVDRRHKRFHVHEFRCANCTALFDEPIDSKTDQPAETRDLMEALRQ